MSHFAAVPFFLHRSHEDSTSEEESISTTERVHGLLRLEGEDLFIQWRVDREIEHESWETSRTDREIEPVREVVIPVAAIASATVRRRGWLWWSSPRLVLTAADLRAFEEIAGGEGLRLVHPATLELGIQRSEGLAAREFAAELSLARAEHALQRGEATNRLTGGDARVDRPAGPRSDA